MSQARQDAETRVNLAAYLAKRAVEKASAKALATKARSERAKKGARSKKQNALPS